MLMDIHWGVPASTRTQAYYQMELNLGETTAAVIVSPPPVRLSLFAFIPFDLLGTFQISRQTLGLLSKFSSSLIYDHSFEVKTETVCVIIQSNREQAEGSMTNEKTDEILWPSNTPAEKKTSLKTPSLSRLSHSLCSSLPLCRCSMPQLL